MNSQIHELTTLLSQIDFDHKHPANDPRHAQHEAALAAYEKLSGILTAQLDSSSAADIVYPRSKVPTDSGPKIYNIALTGTIPPGAVYVGRCAIFGSTKWGNPFVIGQDGDSELAIARLYIDYLINNPALVAAAKAELKGKSLCCHCWPRLCHAEILRLISSEDIDLQRLSAALKTQHETYMIKYNH